MAELHVGDCRDVMATMDASSVDSIVTDPPYGIGFMEKGWDHGVPGEEFWREALRVAKPGAHLLAFGGTRTFHRLAVAIEDAGWEIRDTIMWVYGQGMPKSLNVAKAIDAKIQTGGSAPSNIRRRDMGEAYRPHRLAGTPGFGMSRGAAGGAKDRDRDDDEPISPLVTEEARYWDGWGTALKPSVELIVVARKPLCGTVAENVLRHGTGGINIDGCRVGAETIQTNFYPVSMTSFHKSQAGREYTSTTHTGRWPANVIHDGSDEVLALFPETPSAGEYKEPGHQKALGSRGADINTHLFQLPSAKVRTNTYAGQTGSAARFFYCAKPSKKDRDDGCENNHPTVKPTELMRYLCRLVTPPGGVVLDPFCGSGSTGRGAVLEGMSFIGIDLSEEYIEIARCRIAATKRTVQITPQQEPLL